jgi:hypothetical protein
MCCGYVLISVLDISAGQLPKYNTSEHVISTKHDATLILVQGLLNK